MAAPAHYLAQRAEQRAKAYAAREIAKLIERIEILEKILSARESEH